MVVASVTLLDLLGVGGTAHASYNNTSLDAGCGHKAVTAYASNLQGSSWSVHWNPTLYRYTTAGWQPYLVGPWKYQSSASWMVDPVNFTNLPSNTYCQVRDTVQWYYNGAAHGAVTPNVFLNHFLDGMSVNLSAPESRNSTPSSCFVY